MTFLPEDYKIPASTGNYTKFKDGETNFRILSSAVVGYEYWNTDNKPVRTKEAFEGTPADIKLEKNKETGEMRPTKIKPFWAFIVWNYEANRIQIMEIDKITIMNPLKALVDNKKWGDPKGYDITITRTGEGFDTEYQTMPNPHSELDEKIVAEYESKVIDLEKLYTGEDPFAQ